MMDPERVSKLLHQAVDDIDRSQMRTLQELNRPPDPRFDHGRTHRRLTGFVAALLAATVTAVAIWAIGPWSDRTHGRQIATQRSSIEPLSNPTILGQWDLGIVPFTLAVGMGSIWVGGTYDTGNCRSVVLQLDPTTLKTIASVPVDGSITSMAAGSGSIWLGFRPCDGRSSEGAVAVLDPSTHDVSIVSTRSGTDGGPSTIVVTDAGVLAAYDQGQTGPPGWIESLDPTTGATIWRADLTGIASVVGTTSQTVWALDTQLPSGGQLVSYLVGLDPSTGAKGVSIAVPEAGLAVAAEQGVWVEERGDWAASLQSGGSALGPPIHVPGGFAPFAVDTSGVWFFGKTNEQRAISHLNASTTQVDASLPLPAIDYRAGAFDEAGQTLWALDDGGNLLKIGQVAPQAVPNAGTALAPTPSFSSSAAPESGWTVYVDGTYGVSLTTPDDWRFRSDPEPRQIDPRTLFVTGSPSVDISGGNPCDWLASLPPDGSVVWLLEWTDVRGLGGDPKQFPPKPANVALDPSSLTHQDCGTVNVSAEHLIPFSLDGRYFWIYEVDGSASALGPIAEKVLSSFGVSAPEGVG